MARASAPQTESTWTPPHSIHLEVQEPEKKIIQTWALQMIDPAKRSQPKCNSQKRQNTAPEFVGFIQHQITRILQKVHAKVKIKMVIINCTMPILTDN